MPRPRRKVSKQKAALRQQQKKKQHPKGSEEETTPELEELKQKQKERRRRILWGDEYDDDDEEDGSDYYDEDEDEEDDEYDSEEEGCIVVHEGDNDKDNVDECEAWCPNPDCKNYTVDACPDFQMPPNAVLVRSVLVGVPQLTLTKLRQGVFDLKKQQYMSIDIQRADAKDFLLCFDKPVDLYRIVRDGMIVVDGYRYPAYILPTGSEGDFFRDYNTKDPNWMKMNPWFSTWKGDLGTGLRSAFRRNDNKYMNIAMMLDKGFKEIQAQKDDLATNSNIPVFSLSKPVAN
ncbi:hypothetical protein TRICI_001868 [Trichomonascus ciferrii]|uniref:Uncharacterized protein n=1 Tax=Trichomonascus ciferrii TaxID=44093 RepID=A0A642V830_9ASCO|nr:hypothetical protein TRICI_001868 [Trichomonascus ciferrii]